jgi:hypothetical protein
MTYGEYGRHAPAVTKYGLTNRPPLRAASKTHGWNTREPTDMARALVKGWPQALIIICCPSFQRPRRRRVCDLGVARCAEHRYAVRKLPRALLHTYDRGRTLFVSG